MLDAIDQAQQHGDLAGTEIRDHRLEGLDELATDTGVDLGERGGTVEQAPLSPLLRAAIDAFDEAGPDAAFEQGLAVIVDGLAKRRLVVRNVEGPRKGDD